MAHSKLYVQLMNSRQWRDLRTAKLRANPLCERCQEKGYVVAATCCHHVIPIESARTEVQARELCYSFNNLQSLCYQCHKAIHEADDTWKASHHKEVAQNRLQRWIDQHTKTDQTT